MAGPKGKKMRMLWLCHHLHHANSIFQVTFLLLLNIPLVWYGDHFSPSSWLFRQLIACFLVPPPILFFLNFFFILRFLFLFLFIYLFSFIFISWRLITLQYCSDFCHTLTWISHGFTCIPHPDPLSHLLFLTSRPSAQPCTSRLL